MAKALSPEEQIRALRRDLAERDAIIAAREAELAEAAVVKTKRKRPVHAWNLTIDCVFQAARR